MKNFILIWEFVEYPEMGGGRFFETFKEIDQMDLKVDKLHEEYGEKLNIEFAGEVNRIFDYKPIKVVEKLARME